MNIHQQSTILSAIEDLETVTPRVFAQCEECFRSTLLHYHSYERRSALAPPSPHNLLKKSVSSGLNASTFSLIGSEMLESLGRSSTTTGSGSGILVSLPESSTLSSSAAALSHGSKRGWDWRAGLPEDAKAGDFLRVLRLGLAKGLSFGLLGQGGGW